VERSGDVVRFEDYDGLNEPKATEFLRCVLFEEVGHLENLSIRQT